MINTLNSPYFQSVCLFTSSSVSGILNQIHKKRNKKNEISESFPALRSYMGTFNYKACDTDSCTPLGTEEYQVWIETENMSLPMHCFFISKYGT